jgi:predicted AAA+ superfamily ATPase
MHRYLPRLATHRIREALRAYPVVALLGPRQCGKSTLAKKILSGLSRVVYLDLERPSDRAKIQDPEGYFETNSGSLICLDEVQRAPEIFPVLRSISDSRGKPGQFLVLGSASRDLLRQSSETLAGRIAYLEMTPFLIPEVPEGDTSMRKLWVRGGFPKSFQAASDAESFEWRLNFIRTFLERDVPMLAPGISAHSIERLWSMCAHWHGQSLNYSGLSQALGVSDNTVRNWLDLLAGAFAVRLLPPFSGNLKKRLVKAPKLYIRDPGILHALLSVESMEELHGHPVYGASWEGFALENILANLRPGVNPSFYRDSNGSEIDLILEKGQKRLAVEFKAGTVPEMTRTSRQALEGLGNPTAIVISRAKESFPIAKDIHAMPLGEFLVSKEAAGFLFQPP